MADIIKIFLLTCLGIISCSGTPLNLMTIYVLLFNRTLYEKVASVRWLMLGSAFADTIVCCVGVPDMFANILVGDAPPYTTVPFLCHINELLGFAMTYVSMWYQTTIAMSRLAAVMVPNWYRNKLSRPLGTVLLIIWPWFIGYIGYIVGAILKAYAIYPTPGTGTCVPNQYDDTPAAGDRLTNYLFVDTVLHCWIPMGVGLVCYVSIYTKIFLSRRRSNLQQQRNSVRPSVAITTPGDGHGSILPRQKLDNSSGAGKMVTHLADGASTAVAAASTVKTTDPAHNKRNDERDKKIKLLAITYVVNITLTLPLCLAWGFDYYTYYSDVVPFLARALDVMYFMAFPTNPVIYVLVSNDFRLAFRQIFRRGQVVPQQ